MTVAVKALIERQMRDDDETTAVQFHALLLRHGHTMTLKTVLRCRAALGWTFRDNAYCQLIRQQNKVKRLLWAQDHLSEGVATGRESYLILLFNDELFRSVRSFRLNGWGRSVQWKRSFRFRFIS